MSLVTWPTSYFTFHCIFNISLSMTAFVPTLREKICSCLKLPMDPQIMNSFLKKSLQKYPNRIILHFVDYLQIFPRIKILYGTCFQNNCVFVEMINKKAFIFNQIQHKAINSLIQFSFKVGLNTYTLRLGSIYFLFVHVVITNLFH